MNVVNAVGGFLGQHTCSIKPNYPALYATLTTGLKNLDCGRGRKKIYYPIKYFK